MSETRSERCDNLGDSRNKEASGGSADGQDGLAGFRAILNRLQMKIVDLAEKLMRYRSNNAKISFMGLRPNRKLHEVLAHDGEEFDSRLHQRIWNAAPAIIDQVALDELSAATTSALAECLHVEVDRVPGLIHG